MNYQTAEDQTGNLTNWKKEPTLADLKFDLEGAKPAQLEHLNNVQRWNDLLNVKGKAKPPKIKGRSEAQPKLIRRQAEWRYSALTEPFLGSAKMFEVKPKTFEDSNASKQNEMLLNHQFNTVINKVVFIDNFVRTAVDEGSAIVRIGWLRATKMVKETVPVYQYEALIDPEQIQEFEGVVASKKDDLRTFKETAPKELQKAVEYFEETGQPNVASVVGEEEVEVEKVLQNHPTAEVMNPANVFLDPSCQGDFNKAQYAIFSFETSKAELLKEPKRYKKEQLDKVDWANLATIVEPEHETKTPTDFQFKDEARKRVVAYEYWGFRDINDDGVLVPIVATWVGNQLLRMELNPFPDEKIPLVLVNYLPVKRSVFGETDAELLGDNQAILGATMRGMIDLMARSANGQQGFAKGMLDPLNKRKYENGQDYEYNPSQSPSGNLIEHKFPEIPQSAMLMVQLQNQEAEALTGVKSFAGGISGNAYGDVAAGIRGVLDAASKREMAILRRLSKGITEIGEKITSMNAVFLSEEETVRITNEEFVVILREDLKGKFDLIVDISTAEIDEQKSKDLSFMLQTMGPDMDPAMTRMILSEIAYLKKMPELANKIAKFQPQPDPLQEKLKELQIAKIQAEIDKITADTNLANAKAKEAEANADKKALDFVEQETGTQHERALAQAEAQAQGNKELTITKALVTPKKENERDPDIEGGIGYTELSRNSGRNSVEPAATPLQRDLLAEDDPRYSLSSRFRDPAADPATNPNMNM